MSAVVKAAQPPITFQTGIVPGWRWRTSREGDVTPASMRTTHLFYTLRMIWNHSMPTSMKVGRNVQMYRFGARHDARYMRSAIIHIGAELFGRDDLSAWMKRELDEMAAHLRKVPGKSFIEDARSVAFLPARQEQAA